MKLPIISLIVSVATATGALSQSPPTQNPAILKTFGGYVAKKNYNCPTPTLVEAKGPIEEGDLFRVFCTAKSNADKGGIEPVLVFRLIVRPNGEYSVSKWVD